MLILSFAWTTPQFLAGIKTVTRRIWTPKYAARFHGNPIVQAYNRQPRFGGKRIGWIKVKDIRRERLELVTNDDVAKEGFPGQSREWFIDRWGISGRTLVYRLEFEKVNPNTIRFDPELTKIMLAYAVKD